MLKRIISLVVVVSLSVSMLTGCAFLIPFLNMGAKELEGRADDKSTDDKRDRKSHGDSEDTSEDRGAGVYDTSAINKLLQKIYETEYQPSSFIQEDVESETVQWICATYALYNQVNGKDVTRISGFENLSLANQEILDALQEKMKIHIWDAWGVDNRKTLVEKVHKLLNKEDRADEKQLLGWDLSRANQMIGDAYYIGFINLEECLDLSLLISQQIQNIYQSWDELSESHLYGLKAFRQDDPNDPESESGKRLVAYEELKVAAEKGEGPYAIPFDMELVKSWDATTAEANKDEREAKQAEEDENLSGATVTDEEGRITVHGYAEENPYVKLKIPQGFAETRYSHERKVYVTDIEDEIEIAYHYNNLYGDQDPKTHMEEEKQFALEFDPDTTSVIVDNYEDNDGEVACYFGIEIKDFYDEGNSMIEYYGYMMRKIDGEWAGLYSKIQTDSEANVSKEDAVAWLFPDVQFP